MMNVPFVGRCAGCIGLGSYFRTQRLDAKRCSFTFWLRSSKIARSPCTRVTRLPCCINVQFTEFG